MAIDDLATQGGIASAVMVLTYFSNNISASAAEGLWGWSEKQDVQSATDVITDNKPC